MRLIKHKTHIDFLGKKRRMIALAVSVLVVVISFASLATRGLEFGIDFTGGILLEVGYPEAANLENIRNNLAEAGYDDAQVQRFGEDTDVLVRLPPQDGTNPDELRNDLRRTIAEGTSGVDLRRVEFVSPQVGKELTERGGLAMIIAMLLIFVYVMIRFQWKFAAGAVAALAHDVIVTVGFFSIFRFPFDLTVVAAVLAVIGYSLNDTVVAFDRIRENFFKLRGIAAEESMNISINEMLARTIITGVTTLLVLVALVAAGRRIDCTVLDRTDRGYHRRHVFVDLHGQRNGVVTRRQCAGPARAREGSGPDRRPTVVDQPPRTGSRSAYLLPVWLPAVRFTTGNKHPALGLPGVRRGPGTGVRARASCEAPRRRTPKQAEYDVSEPWMASEVKLGRVPGVGPV